MVSTIRPIVGRLVLALRLLFKGTRRREHMKSMPTRDPLPSGRTRSMSGKPIGDAPLKTVTAGGWFVAEDLNGDPLVVRLPPRTERGS